MHKNKKLLLVGLSIAAVLVAGAATYHGLAAERYQTVTAYGLEIKYPAEWRESPYQFYITATAKQDGVIVSSPDTKITVAIAPKYTGDLKTETPGLAVMQAEAMLVDSAPLKHLPGVSAVRMVTHYYGPAGADHYTSSEVLMTDKQLQELGLQRGRMVKIDSGSNPVIASMGASSNISVGFNSQESLTRDQAVRWHDTSEARTAYAILMSAQLQR